mmetsp:Transcript_10763/g.29706  ORF Transcript_10763/g.29706 Transcript_10763/m.29706 type:complete len:251 (-) Transcript_10763:1095-1847(-)
MGVLGGLGLDYWITGCTSLVGTYSAHPNHVFCIHVPPRIGNCLGHSTGSHNIASCISGQMVGRWNHGVQCAVVWQLCRSHVRVAMVHLSNLHQRRRCDGTMRQDMVRRLRILFCVELFWCYNWCFNWSGDAMDAGNRDIGLFVVLWIASILLFRCDSRRWSGGGLALYLASLHCDQWVHDHCLCDERLGWNLSDDPDTRGVGASWEAGQRCGIASSIRVVRRRRQNPEWKWLWIYRSKVKNRVQTKICQD